jgi:hypothetical protein
MLSRTGLIIVVLTLSATSWMHAGTYKLKAVQSGETYGPFAYKANTYIKVESGIFKLNIISGRTFKLMASDSRKSYGVYELVPGRIIDVGDTLFTITDIRASRPPATAAASRSTTARYGAPPTTSVFANTALGLEYEFLDSVGYDWTLNAANGAGEKNIDRNSISLRVRHNYLTGRLGLVTSSEWDHSLAGSSNTFQNASIEEGTGWFAGVGVNIPVFADGGWKANIFGELSYRQEELSLEYGEQAFSSTTSTNGVSNIVTTVTSQSTEAHSEDATLTEMLAVVGASVSYESDFWFIYGGIKALPWSDTDLDAIIVTDGSRYTFEFERTDPVMGYGGVGFIIAGTKCYLEAEGGGETAVRIGLLKEL